MTVRGWMVRRGSFALLLASVILLGTVVGGAIFETTNPSLDRIVWLEHDVADESGQATVRRALFADGRFLALSPNGYRAGILDPTVAFEIFAAARAGAKSWQPAYRTPALLGEQIDLLLEGRTTTRVAISNPGMNFNLPPDLARVLRLLSTADLTVARTGFAPSSLRFIAEPVAGGQATFIEAVPFEFPMEAAARPGGIAIGGAELSVLRTQWQDLDMRLDPSLNHRFVEAAGRTWRVSWQLDLDSIGPISAAGSVQ